MHVRHAPLFVFASFARVNGQRAVRVFFECNTRASNGQHAIRAACACNMRASTRASVFAAAHAFSCCLDEIFYGNWGAKFPSFCGTERIISFWLADLFKNDTSGRHATCR
jgi:hypothetical protein